MALAACSEDNPHLYSKEGCLLYLEPHLHICNALYMFFHLPNQHGRKPNWWFDILLLQAIIKSVPKGDYTETWKKSARSLVSWIEYKNQIPSNIFPGKKMNSSIKGWSYPTTNAGLISIFIPFDFLLSYFICKQGITAFILE